MIGGVITGFEQEKYFAISRSFFKMDISSFTFPSEYIDSSIMEFIGYGGEPEQGKDEYYFLLKEVSGDWGEHTVTWATQPPVSSNSITLKSPPKLSSGRYADLYSIDVTKKVKRWVSQPDKNFGFGLSLQNEKTESGNSFTRRISIPGSDSQNPGSPSLEVIFSNPSYMPEEAALIAGTVEAGDTVLVSYHNGSRSEQAATKRSITSQEIGGTSYTGRQILFEDRNRREFRTFGEHDFPEFLELFMYVGTSNESDIMLGETKYYAAVKDPETEEISIKEVKTDDAGKPETPNNLVANAFSENLIEVVSGDKSGVYWERKWATIDDKGNVSTGELPSGMIRVIGRYWEKDKEYKVKLKASADVELGIKVVKPTKLGDKYGKARDVFDKVVDVDSLIIANAGKYGILPQLVKGQIEKESAKKEFVGIGIGFAPSYRYEPYYTDPYKNRYFRYWAGDFYFENSASADFSNIPNHKHVLFVDYYREVKTVWNIIKESSQLVSEAGSSTFGKKTAADTLDFGPYKSIQRKYSKIYKRINSDSTLKLNQSEIADSTNKLMVKYLRDEWQGGMKNHIAQTRVASSYGYLQPMFTTAKEKGYPDDKVPEDINLTRHFFYFVKNQKKMISDQIGKDLENGNNWPKGYEKTIRDIVYLNWNETPSYPDDILEFSKKYYPEK